MLESLDIGERTISSFRGIAPDHLLDKLNHLAATLSGARVLHINATPYGGGVSELLRSVVPLLNGLGLVADWRIIRGDDRFFQVTKSMHNGLQGATLELSDEHKALYLQNTNDNARAFSEEYDFIFIHDPQPAALLATRGKGGSKWIWRCHIDTSAPNAQVWTSCGHSSVTTTRPSSPWLSSLRRTFPRRGSTSFRPRSTR